MGAFCAAPRKPKVVDSKTYITLLSEVTSITESCLDKIVVNLKRFEIIEALGIFLNGLYSYLLKTQSVLLENPQEIEPYDDDGIIQLKKLMDKLLFDLKDQDFLYDKELHKLQIKKIVDIDLSFKFLRAQLEKHNPIANHPYLGGDFQKGFEFILSKTLILPNYLIDEMNEIVSSLFILYFSIFLLKIFKENDYKSKMSCNNCQNPLKFFINYQEFSPNAPEKESCICDKCKHCLLYSAGFWKCEPCNVTVCKLCDSEGAQAQCKTCKKALQFTKDLSSQGYKTVFFKCNICGNSEKWEDGVHHCFFEDDSYDLCVKCRSRMVPKHLVYVLMENQRWWKNQWTDCPQLPMGK